MEREGSRVFQAVWNASGDQGNPTGQYRGFVASVISLSSDLVTLGLVRELEQSQPVKGPHPMSTSA